MADNAAVFRHWLNVGPVVHVSGSQLRDYSLTRLSGAISFLKTSLNKWGARNQQQEDRGKIQISVFHGYF